MSEQVAERNTVFMKGESCLTSTSALSISRISPDNTSPHANSIFNRQPWVHKENNLPGRRKKPSPMREGFSRVLDTDIFLVGIS